MRLNPDTVPVTLSEAVSQLEFGLSNKERAELLHCMTAGSLHFTLGTMIRNAWDMHTTDTPLRKWFKRKGVRNGDDASYMIIQALLKKLQKKRFNFTYERDRLVSKHD